ncbi:MAG: hypothetical protein NT026_01620 [Candidatus Staskawiczbacteria bacterium]|nr:hypothetical protein [Candidatus Staskawiczbacteria bacterium]
MEAQTKTCQNCKKDFTIEPDDFAFYEKMKVPAPTFCPECRLMRKMTWRNERTLYKRNCGKCGKQIVSIYPTESPFVVYCQDCWWSDSWDPMATGAIYNFSRPFMTQFVGLLQQTPSVALFNTTPSNSDYCNYMSGARNCYLQLAGRESEEILYSNRIYMCKDSADCYTGTRNERCYQCIQCENSFNLKYSQYCDTCVDSNFLFDCRNCQNCSFSTNLRGKQYYLFNRPYTKEEYFLKLKEFDFGSYKVMQDCIKKFDELRATALRKYAQMIKTSQSTGDNLKNSKNCKECFDFSGDNYEDCAYSHYIGIGLKDSYDVYGLSRGERLYESLSLGFESTENANYMFSQVVKGSTNIFYSLNCTGSHDLFGCTGLRSKQYCILNKQYTKEEYEELLPKIIEHMNAQPYIDKRGRIYKYGEFFAPELSPFAYNETIAQEYFPLSKEEAEKQGYSWKDSDKRAYNVTKTAEQLPDNIKNVDDSIFAETIQCLHNQKCNEQCTQAFKIIPQELQFYKKMNLPLPRLCPNCRHYQRLVQRNPLKLWHRQCMCDKNHAHHTGKCTNEFETPYAPDRPEIVYCEQCYQQEVI